MSEPKTEYNPENYNPNSLSNIMQFITADLMIKHDIEVAEAFAEFQPQIVQIRQKIQVAHKGCISKKDYADVSVANVAEGVLLWLRDGATVKDVLKSPLKALMIRGKRVVRK
jgi:hypothetical protein